MTSRLAAVAIFALSLPFAVTAASAANDMAGSWTVERADDAPWSNTTDYQPFHKVVPDYLHKKVVFEAKRIKGPSLLACAKPNYEMKDYTADMLFQGQLGESEQRGGKKAEDVATSLGYKSRPIRTLETGCEGAIDFHMTDADHAAFALDNVLYWLTRDKTK
jgi:hypothetical protein